MYELNSSFFGESLHHQHHHQSLATMAAMMNILTACVLLLTCFNGEVLSQFRFRRQQFLDKFRYKGSGPCPSVQANFTVMQDFDPVSIYFLVVLIHRPTGCPPKNGDRHRRGQ